MLCYLDIVHRGPFAAWACLLPSSSVVAVVASVDVDVVSFATVAA